MCNECGCGMSYAPTSRTARAATPAATPSHETVVAVRESLFGANEAVAAQNRATFRTHGVLALNLMSSPGTGKTYLLETLIPLLARIPLRCAVVVGDLETDNDAQRIARTGAHAIQITTGQACHLDATMVADVLPQLDLAALDILFIENVGNLVCPASFDLGEARRIALLSVCEGDDKPAKYPTLFHKADLMLITKADLLPYLPQFEPARSEACLRALANHSPCLTISSMQPETLAPLVDWLVREHAALKQPAHAWKAV
ncbi:MAG: hydrogenase nickel incorporation protein HypB [Proteobacteria bacterium]|nr:hydrogenase nickel incorporation protein HypB [Pseudomonadota bacterium]